MSDLQQKQSKHSPSPWPSPQKERVDARLVEIFSSIQGEGMRIGERQSFIRFQGCELKCRWCDTPENFTYQPEYRVETEAFLGHWEKFKNPVSTTEVWSWIEKFSDPMVSLTGGEPLQQVEFLQELLNQNQKGRPFLLETSGVLPEALEKIVGEIYTVSMDIKLPSSAQTGEFWPEHEAFLKIAQKAPELYVKIVVTESTLASELEKALNLVKSISEDIPVILQPASQTRAFKASPSSATLAELSKVALKSYRNIRIIPQTHKFLGIA